VDDREVDRIRENARRMTLRAGTNMRALAAQCVRQAKFIEKHPDTGINVEAINEILEVISADASRAWALRAVLIDLAGALDPPGAPGPVPAPRGRARAS